MFEEIFDLVEKGVSVEKAKLIFAKRHGFIPKNSVLLKEAPPALRHLFVKKPKRTASGVAVIALMPPPTPCPGRCIYCPVGENAPQSYTGREPAALRAIQNNYSAAAQIRNRLSQYKAMGHPTHKLDLIIMGGTFPAAPKTFKDAFVKEIYETLNGQPAPTLADAIRANEHAEHRVIGLTIETRPDFVFPEEFLSWGTTRVELGVQVLDDAIYERVRRGHTVEDVVRATETLRRWGFKIIYHMMPGLLTTPEQDLEFFRRLFEDERFRPDGLKIYPTLVVKGTKLYRMWKQGKYKPYTEVEAVPLLAKVFKMLPPYVRVQRVQRDIPAPLIEAGVKSGNLRELIHAYLKERGWHTKEIRSREAGYRERLPSAPEMKEFWYKANKGDEVFLSLEEDDTLFGYLRLRFQEEAPSSVLAGRALVREIRIVGQPVGFHERGHIQHRGFGRALLMRAEELAEERGLGVAVISGVGVREYFRKQGYRLEEYYMVRDFKC